MDTKTKILNAAESEFAEKGISQTSLRSIVSKAGVNVAAVHYHFGSKEELLGALFARRISSVNDERLKLLSELREKFKQTPIPVEDLLRAFFAPALEMALSKSDGKKNFLRCVARAQSETDPGVQTALMSNFREVLIVFTSELEKTCPNLKESERLMRFSFTIGAMVHSIMMPLKPMIVDKYFDGGFPEEHLLEMLVSFCSSGMKANSLVESEASND